MPGEPTTDAAKLRRLAKPQRHDYQDRDLRDIADRVERLEKIEAAASDPFIVRLLRIAREGEATTELGRSTDAAIDVLFAALEPPTEVTP